MFCPPKIDERASGRERNSVHYQYFLACRANESEESGRAAVARIERSEMRGVMVRLPRMSLRSIRATRSRIVARMSAAICGGTDHAGSLIGRPRCRSRISLRSSGLRSVPGAVLAVAPGLLCGDPVSPAPIRVRFAEAPVPGDDFHAALLETEHPAILDDRTGADRLHRAPGALVGVADAFARPSSPRSSRKGPRD